MYVIAALLLVPFVAGGVYSLDCRYRRQEEWPLAVEALMLAAVSVFLAVEVALLRGMLSHQAVYLMFSVLGLCVAATALYGHVFVSLASRLLVDAVAGAEEGASERPRFGPAEALERQGAHEDALQEYLVLARIFPREAEVHGRIAACHLAIGQPEEAAKWWRRANKYAAGAGEALPYVNRLCDVFTGPLADREAARAVLQAYLVQYATSPDAGAVRARLAQLDAPEAAATHRAAGLAALDEAPLDLPPDEPAPLKPAQIRLGLDAMDAAAADSVEKDAGAEVEPADAEPPARPRLGLASLDADPIDDTDDGTAGR